MPLLRTLGVHVPVILVASKLDLAENTNDELVEVSLFACLQGESQQYILPKLESQRIMSLTVTLMSNHVSIVCFHTLRQPLFLELIKFLI